MNEFEFLMAVVSVVSIFVIFPLGMTKMILSHRRAKFQATKTEGVKMSELEQSIVQAVSKATAPMQAQLDRIETRLEEEELAIPRLLTEDKEPYLYTALQHDPEKTAGRMHE